MIRSLLAFALLLPAACGVESTTILTPPAAAAAAPGPADRVALLVGIDRYAPGSPVSPLKGCGRDVERMRDLLVGRFGFKAEDVHVLRDEQATHAAIVRAFDSALIQRARRGTEAVFYFAGHGSRVPDLDEGAAREADGLDSTYLAYDSRADGHDGDRDLTDDELRSLTVALAEKGAFTTVLTDSCHSGGGLRGIGGFRARAAPQGRRPLDRGWAGGFWPGSIGLLDDSQPAPVVLGSYVHVAASRRDQVAGEIDVETAPGELVPHGAMTWYLAQALDRVQPGVTWSAVTDQTSLHVTTALPYQNLTYSGAADRVVFGASFEEVTGWRARSLGGDLVLVDAGWLAGLRRGSRLDIRASPGTRSVGVALVEWLSAAQARARFLEAPGEDLSKVALRAVEIGRPLGEEPLAVWCEVPGLAPWFAGSPWVQMASRIETADLIVRGGTQGYHIWTPDGLLLPGYLPILPPTFGDQSGWLSVCEPLLRREALWRSTSRLALEPGGLGLDVSLVAATEADCRAPLPAGGWTRWVPAHIQDRVVYGAPGIGGDLPMGVFRVHNPGRSAVHLAVLNLPENDRTRTLIDPLPGSDARVLRPGETCSVRVGFLAPDAWSLARPMCDRYLFLATLGPIDLVSLTSSVTLRGDEAPLPGVLRQAQAKYVTRGSGTVDLDRSGYGIAAVDVHVKRR